MKSNKYKQLRSQIKENKITFTFYVLLRAFVLAAMIFSFFTAKYENVFVCALCLILFLVPAFVEKNFSIKLPTVLEVLILLFIFAAEILGEMNSYYSKIPFWDTMLHTINGFLCAAIGFSLVDLLNTNKHAKFQLSPFYLAAVAFCFSMTIGIIWEFFEFSCDLFLHTDMQKDCVINMVSSSLLNPDRLNTPVIIKNITETNLNGEALPINGYLDIGLYDTMKDLFVNFIGAVVFSIIGYFYVKNRGKGKFARHFIPIVENKEGDNKN